MSQTIPVPHDAPDPTDTTATDTLHRAILALLNDFGYLPEWPTIEHLGFESELYFLLTEYGS